MSQTALSLIKGALRRINSYQTGEPIAAPDANDCLETLNDLLDSWSIDKQLIFGSVENILTLNSGQAQYKIGNPSCTDLALPTLTGYTVSGSPIITGVFTQPTMTFGSNSSGVLVGGTLTDTAAAIPSGATIVSYSVGVLSGITFTAPPTGSAATLASPWGGVNSTGLITFSDGETRTGTVTNGSTAISWTTALTGTPLATGGQINTANLVMSLNALSTQIAADTITYTVPGDFAIPRPNRITNAFTRFSQLDFTIEVTMSQSRFLEILYKAQPGPWPTVAWYNPQDPYGLINFYQTPGNSAQLHLFTDTILANLTLNQVFMLPSGYARAIKWNLAKEICAEYGIEPASTLITNAAESKAMIKALNATPAVKARYDRMLLRGSRVSAGWILNGGFD